MTILFNGSNNSDFNSCNEDSSTSTSTSSQSSKIPSPVNSIEMNSSSSLDAQVKIISPVIKKTSISKEELVKVEELEKAFLSVEKDGDFAKWVLAKTKSVDSSAIRLKGMLTHDLFSHFIRIQNKNNISRFKISRLDFNRKYKPSIDRLKGLYSLLRYFNDDVFDYKRGLVDGFNKINKSQDLSGLLRINKNVEALTRANNLLGNEIINMLNKNTVVRKVTSAKVRSELIFYVKFFKFISENDQWGNLNLPINSIVEYLKRKGVTVEKTSANELFKIGFLFLDRIQNYVDLSMVRTREIVNCFGNPKTPVIGSAQVDSNKLFSLELDKKCRSLQQKVRAFTR